MGRRLWVALVAAVLVVSGAVSSTATAPKGEWSRAVNAEQARPGAHASFNTPEFTEGCPFIAKDGKTFFMASNRTGSLGGLDIWVSKRASTKHAWGKPFNPSPPLNSTANDFCPTLAADGKTFYFVSTRPGHCGDTANGDIYRARMSSKHRFSGITHLGCKVNSPYDEHSPFPITLRKQSWLYFSSARAASATDAPGDHDIYAAKRQGQRYGKPSPVRGVNTEFQDGQPNVSKNGRELYFYSNRPGTIGEADIYVATRKNTKAAWSTPKNLGPKVNSTAAETRPSLSWDGRTLYFGTTREGSSDIYVTKRSGK